MLAHARANEAVRASIEDYDARMTRGEVAPIYQFGEGVLEGEDLTMSTEAIRVPGYGQPISLDVPNPYDDMSP
jgi:acetoacetyl-[acyl-carrier protein] synthase